MKKYISAILIFFSISIGIFYMSVDISFAACEYNGGSITAELDNCLSGSDLVHPGDGLIESGIKNKVVYWTTQLAGLLGLFAVGAIVYGGLMMTISGGEDEKIKKGKDIVKWSMLGFLGVIVAGGIVRLIVEVMFSVAG